MLNYRSFRVQEYSLLIGAFLLVACSSKKIDPARPIETKMEKTQRLDSSEEVGVKGDNIVVQRKVYLAEELRKLQNEVYALEDEVYGNRSYQTIGLYGVYKECKSRLADKRIGGAGRLEPIEKAERVIDTEAELKIGIDEGKQLVGISEEGLRDRIDRFRGFRRILRKRADEYHEKIEICESDYRTALIDNGLKPEDTKSKGEWVMGPQGFRVWRAVTLPTNDPEELARRKAKGERAPLKMQNSEENSTED